MNVTFDFSGKTVLVTGGSSGIGAATALAFKKAGADVLATGATQAEVDSANAQAAKLGIRFAQLDVTDGAAVKKLIDGMPRIDVVVNSAGMIRRDEEHEPETFAKVIDVNLNGGMRVTTAAREKLKATKGSVVFIGSVMSYFGGPKQPAYSASKGGVRNLTMSLAAAYAADGIRVNAVAPGWVVTELSRGARENLERNAQIMARVPVGRWAEPAEIADPILFLASDAARYVTGTMMTVDGGYTSVG